MPPTAVGIYIHGLETNKAAMNSVITRGQHTAHQTKAQERAAQANENVCQNCPPQLHCGSAAVLAGLWPANDDGGQKQKLIQNRKNENAVAR